MVRLPTALRRRLSGVLFRRGRTPVRRALADVLEAAADAVWEVGEIVSSRPDAARRRLERYLSAVERAVTGWRGCSSSTRRPTRGRGGSTAPCSRRWTASGSRWPPRSPVALEWRPPPLSQRQRSAVRRLVGRGGRR